jgi:nickel-dependent lactate racemase
MRIRMHYGKKGLDIDLPDDLETTIIKKRKMPILPDPGRAVREAFSHPMGSKTLRDEAKDCRKICILICDITRPVPNGIVLTALLQELLEEGVDPDSVTILVATGLHRPNEGEELRELVGNDWVVETVRVVNHFARNADDHVFLGTTPFGMPVKVDRRFVEADLRMVIGLVEPHFMAGYSGGRKIIIPGIAHEETIRVLHKTQLLIQDGVSNCRLEGNPLHEELVQAAAMAGHCLAVNTVIDETRNLSFVNFGSLKESHEAAIRFARPFFEIPVHRKFKTVITSASGYPLDRNYYQTVKGMVGVAGILEPDGDLFVVSECSEGLGTQEYAESQGKMIAGGIEAFVNQTLLKKAASIDEWETIMQIKAMRTGRIHLFSDCLSAEEKALTGITVVDSFRQALVECMAKKKDKAVAVVPEGPYVIPFFKSDG